MTNPIHTPTHTHTHTYDDQGNPGSRNRRQGLEEAQSLQ